jgi:acyl-CoA hydrolase
MAAGETSNSDLQQGRAPTFSATHQEHLVRPQHTNAHGTVFGGEVVGWVDIAAATCAMRHCNRAVVTASIDALAFLAPIHVGWVVCLDASVNYAARTSCEVGVKVTAYNPITGERHQTASAYLTFVALDSYGRPTPMPPVVPESPEETRRFEAAQERRKLRLDLKQKQARRSVSP